MQPTSYCPLSSCCSFFKSSIGLKIVMSLTGLGMALFLLVHMAGNLMILVSADKFNAYAHALTGNKVLLYTAELGLIVLVLAHIKVAIRLTQQNRAARPIAYYKRESTGRSRRFFGSSNMGISGLLILAFIVYHLIHFKYGPYIPTTQHEEEIRDLAALVVGEFKEPLEVFLYVAAMFLIGVHLFHGLRSLFDTLGVAKTRWDRAICVASRVYVVVVMGAFTLIPLWIYFVK